MLESIVITRSKLIRKVARNDSNIDKFRFRWKLSTKFTKKNSVMRKFDKIALSLILLVSYVYNWL